MLNPQIEYDQILPEETEPELNLEDALDNLYSERHDKYVSEMLIKALSLILRGCNHDLEALEQRKKERDSHCSQSVQWRDLNKQARNYRLEVSETLDKLKDMLRDEQKEKLFEFYKELI